MSTIFATKKRRAYQKLWNKLDEHLLPLLSKGIVLAISGGPDSRALLEAVASWPNRQGGRFLVVAIDHAIRKEAGEEGQLIAMRAQRLGFEAQCLRLDGARSCGEQELREQRYQLLSSICVERDFKVIATAHQRDDNAEGYFMAVMGVGGGALGCAMAEHSHRGDITICRPFLTLGKEDLLLSLSLSSHTDFVRDSCDEARIGKRALVRHEIFPSLICHVPNLLPRLAMFSRAQRQQHDALLQLAATHITWRNDQAQLSLLANHDAALISAALWQILKKISSGKDLRAAKSAIDAIAQDVATSKIRTNPKKAGLDPTLNGFNVRHLDAKHYHLPGAVVVRTDSEILVRRI